MLRVWTVGAVVSVVLGAGLLIRITHRAGMPSEKPASVPLEVRADQSQPVIETVDLSNGNLHLSIPIRAARQKPAAPPSGHRAE